tara:strand:+ start:788 stop:967 length:180 start_codon:yes stop_codon:yes gene_type:complete
LLESAGVSPSIAKPAGQLLAPTEKKVKRKASAYSIKYGKAKDGFKRAQKAAHRLAKTMK